jgi:hypothetical protein
MDNAKGALALAAGLLVLALVLAVAGLVLQALRWLLILAAVVLLIGGAIGWAARRNADSPG